jgi:hypothetical protein
MEIKIYTVKLDPPRWLRRVLLYVVLPFGVLVGAALAVRASVSLTTFTANTPIKAAEVNANFKNLGDAIAQVQSNVATLQTGLTVDASGKVGVGLATPTETLDVNGNIRLKPTGATVALKHYQATCKADNANADRTTPFQLFCGYGEIPADAYVLGAAVVAGLKNGCAVQLGLDTVHETRSPRIRADISGFFNNKCADVGELTLSYIYLAP